MSLLGFISDDVGKVRSSKHEEVKFKDDEAVDFGWYFSQEYKVKEHKENKEHKEHKEYKHEHHKRKYNENEEDDLQYEENKRPKTSAKQRPIGDLNNDEEKVEKILKAVRKYLKDTLISMGSIQDSVKFGQKAMIVHLYKIIGKLNAESFVKYEFLMTFGVSIESKVQLQKAVENARDYEEFKSYINKIPFKQLLMIHKYFTFAYKKISVIMYHEQTDQVNNNLLYEIEEKEEVKELEKEVQNKRKEAKKVVKANKKVDKLKDDFRQKLKGINEDEFPDLLKPTEQVAFNPSKILCKPTPEKKETVQEVKKKVDDYDELEAALKKNDELHKKHKFDPSQNEKPKVIKKKKNEPKTKLKKEEFPGLPG